MNIKKLTKWVSAAAIVACVAITSVCYASTAATQSFETTTSATASKAKKFEKTRNKCTKSNCSCTGYWGYKHQNGTYEGTCSNTDGHGHTCGHGPEKHGLRKW